MYSNSTLDWADYASLAFVVAISIAVPVYLGVVKHKADLYSARGRISSTPIIISMVASAASGVTFMGSMVESYTQGLAKDVILMLGLYLSTIYCVLVFLPVVCKLELGSMYEYFQLRFDNKVRKLAVVTFIITNGLYTSLALYPPALVISQFSGLSINVISVGVSMMCTFYTVLGGFTGVVWADFLQGLVMYLTYFTLLVLGMREAGGWSQVLELSERGDRLNVALLDPDPTVRLSIWSAGVLGSIPFCCHTCVSETMFRRIESLRSETKAKWAVVGSAIASSIIYLTGTFIGLSIYAYYYSCDPKSANIVSTYDNLVVYWVDEISGKITGFRGVFIAALMCSSLSTISTNLNTLGGLLFTEFVKPKFELSPKASGVVFRALVFTVGVVSSAVSVVERGTGTLTELKAMFCGTGDGLTVGLFILGLLVVPANSKGTFFGGLSSMFIMATMALGSRIYIAKGYIAPYPVKEMMTYDCLLNVTEPAVVTKSTDEPVYVPSFFRVSNFYYSTFAMVLTIATGLAFSYYFKDDREPAVNKKLLASWVHSYVPSELTKEYVQISQEVGSKTGESGPNKADRPSF